MGKIIDFLFSNSWEEYQRIQVYKKVSNKIQEIPVKQINKRLLNKVR